MVKVMTVQGGPFRALPGLMTSKRTASRYLRTSLLPQPPESRTRSIRNLCHV